MKNPENTPSFLNIKEPVQKRSRETRRKIVEAARDLFTEMGFEETTTHLIADKAGMSVGGLYAHFQNKEDIFLYILELRSKEVYQITLDSLKVIQEKNIALDQALDHLYRTWYKAHTRHGKLNQEMLRFCMMNETAGKIHNYWEKAETDAVKSLIARYQEDLAIADVDSAVTVVARSTHEVFHYLYREKDSVDENAVLTSLITMVQRFLVKKN
ncbi:TetR/AcrR family transcriptional regulator [Desulfatibacillum aliphaticivorans]|uniref:Transcriptional regulator, TetR family n=1 Tax=Desulfatibacillum aliphaticivorans TaxID=218208 RepID=B8FNF2_DESAL|nr:TetR/AcrR family transcriptional regulator [Desulfatibacillum aliphaticivorans]ACL06121.1 transcriptional regulator, TetR family [Desulfatibacillum aliphaticivorans]